MLGLAAVFGGAAAGVWFWWPAWRGLVRLVGYTILTNTYISLLPFEPVFFYYANLHPPWLVASVSALGALISGVLDWETLNPLLHARKIRRLYADTRIYRTLAAWYGKAPFWSIVVAALTPIPFYPVKFLALSSGYPEGRYLAALMVGRLPRFYIFAIVGHAVSLPNWLLVATFVVMLASGAVAKVKHRLSRRGASATKPLPTVSSPSTADGPR